MTRCTTLCVVCSVWFAVGTNGFCSVPFPPHRPSCVLFASKKQKNKNKKKKPLDNNNTNYNNNHNNKHAPPWKVLSAKDAKKNVQMEQARRHEMKTSGNVHHSNTATTSVSPQSLQGSSLLLSKWHRVKFGAGQLTFVGGYLDRRQVPPRLGVPEVAFLGRSNVGKSSLLNRLVSSNQARVGKTPGATASVNLYALQQHQKTCLGLVDLPGFGYTQGLSKDTQASVQMAAERYLQTRQELALGLLLVDVRRAIPTDSDKAVLAALYDLGLPLVVVATKRDKIANQHELELNLKSIQVTLGLPEGQPLCVSAETGEGIKHLWSIVMDACEARVEELQDTQTSSHDENDDYENDDDENDELVYSQGYDWIHGTSSYDEIDDKDEWSDDGLTMEPPKNVVSQDTSFLSLKSLKKRARDMERRKEI